MKKFILLGIKSYQKYISGNFSGGSCRFSPTCSQYAYEAVEKYGTIRGLFLGIKRLLRCHPFSTGGFDPVK